MQHPAAKLLVMASKMQEAEVGDGTNLVVVLAGELLVLAEDLLKNGLHCSEIIAGYTTSLTKALEQVKLLNAQHAQAAFGALSQNGYGYCYCYCYCYYYYYY